MSVPTAIKALAAQLRGNVTPPAGNWPAAPLTVYDDPQAAITGTSMPSIMLAQAVNVDHTWGIEAMSGMLRHTYFVGLYLSVALMQQKVNERHQRVLGWPEAITRALAKNITLGGQVAFVGFGDAAGRIWTYRIQPTQWADGTFWGLYGIIPIIEKPQDVALG